jgi:DNA-binding CsgD family transcriptional regulator
VRALTPAEQRVAELVAQGRSNPDVAQALRLSAKTVEWHLSHVYRKLGVRRRGELAAVFGATTPLGRAVAEVEPTGPLPEPRMPRKYGLQRGTAGAESQSGSAATEEGER